MNSAARFHQGVFARGWVLSLLITKTEWLQGALVVSIFVSALSTVYVTHLSHRLHAAIQGERTIQAALHVQWSQLLLEKSTSIREARVQHIAENVLEMETPNPKSVVI